jgi:hypothetical protein
MTEETDNQPAEVRLDAAAAMLELEHGEPPMSRELEVACDLVIDSDVLDRIARQAFIFARDHNNYAEYIRLVQRMLATMYRIGREEEKQKPGPAIRLGEEDD